MKFTNLTLLPLFSFKCVERSLILRFNIWIYIVWLAQQKEKQLNDERKENGLNLPHSTFVVLLFLRSFFATLLDSTPNLQTGRHGGSDTEDVELKRNRGKMTD